MFFYFSPVFYLKICRQKQSMNIQKSSEKQLTAELGIVHDSVVRLLDCLFKKAFSFYWWTLVDIKISVKI